MDVVSLILAAIGLTFIIYGFSHLSDESLVNVIITLVIGLVFLILFGYRQLHSDHPLLRIGVFKNKIFTIGIITNLANVMLIFAIVVLIPMYLETSLHTSSLTASLIMLPGTILGSVLPILSGHIYDDHGPRIVICTGMAIMALSAFLLTMVDLSTSFITVVLIICGFYIGSGLSLSPNQTNTLGNLKSEDYPSGSAIMTSSQQIGGAIGSSLFTSFMTIGENNYLGNIANPTAVQHALALTKGVNFSFELGTIFLVIVFVLTLFLKRNKNYDL